MDEDAQHDTTAHCGECGQTRDPRHGREWDDSSYGSWMQGLHRISVRDNGKGMSRERILEVMEGRKQETPDDGDSTESAWTMWSAVWSCIISKRGWSRL